MTTATALIVESRSEKRAVTAPQSTKKLSLRKAINEKCKECIVDPVCGTGNWRQQVAACTSRACPLYAVRPVSRGGAG